MRTLHRGSAAGLRGLLTAQHCPSCTGPSAPAGMSPPRDPASARNQALLQALKLEVFGRPQSLSAGTVTLKLVCVHITFRSTAPKQIFFLIRVLKSTEHLVGSWAALLSLRRSASSVSCAGQEEGQTPAKSPLPERRGSSAAQTTLTAVPGDRERSSGRLLLLFWLFKCAPESLSFCSTTKIWDCGWLHIL